MIDTLTRRRGFTRKKPSKRFVQRLQALNPQASPRLDACFSWIFCGQ
jgi:hypothetical protein